MAIKYKIMFKKFLDDNKIIFTNCFLILLVLSSFIIKKYGYTQTSSYLKAAGCFGLTCSVINWLALQILLDKLYFLYTTDEIRNYFLPTKTFLVRDIFGRKDFEILKQDCACIITDDDKRDIESNINHLAFNNVLRAFQSEKVKEIIKDSILNKIYEIEGAIKMKLENGFNEEEKKKSGNIFFEEEILPIIDGKLEMSVLAHIQLLTYEAIKEYFEWLVLWGAFCGVAFGLLFRILGCL